MSASPAEAITSVFTKIKTYLDAIEREYDVIEVTDEDEPSRKPPAGKLNVQVIPIECVLINTLTKERVDEFNGIYQTMWVQYLTIRLARCKTIGASVKVGATTNPTLMISNDLVLIAEELRKAIGIVENVWAGFDNVGITTAEGDVIEAEIELYLQTCAPSSDTLAESEEEQIELLEDSLTEC